MLWWEDGLGHGGLSWAPEGGSPTLGLQAGMWPADGVAAASPFLVSEMPVVVSTGVFLQAEVLCVYLVFLAWMLALRMGTPG